MKARRQLALRLLPPLALATLGAGCVGHNHTLFVTKSNAGLDFEATPPTTEITIARKEGVIAPSFEEGATPPVMASFQPHVGSNSGLKNFFFGVDQTFAGGDAAIAMAGLFNRPDAPAFSATEHDSAITVKDPTPKLPWNAIPPAGTVRPFVFATDTMFGLKIGWSGVAQVPDSVKAGFNRKEFAWAPLSKSEVRATTIPAQTVTETLADGSTRTTTRSAQSYNTVSLKIPSFLATVDSDANTEGLDAKVSSVQYFATGKAATLLALQPAVRKALFVRMDPSFKASFNPEILGQTLVMIDSIIQSLADNGDVNAGTLQAALAGLKGITRGGEFGMRYEFDAATNTLTESAADDRTGAGSLGDFIRLDKHLTDALAELDECGAALAKGKTVVFVPAELGGRLLTVRSGVDLRRHLLRTEIEQNPAVQNAYYFVRMKFSAAQ